MSIEYKFPYNYSRANKYLYKEKPKPNHPENHPLKMKITLKFVLKFF